MTTSDPVPAVPPTNEFEPNDVFDASAIRQAVVDMQSFGEDAGRTISLLCPKGIAMPSGPVAPFLLQMIALRHQMEFQSAVIAIAMRAMDRLHHYAPRPGLADQMRTAALDADPDALRDHLAATEEELQHEASRSESLAKQLEAAKARIAELERIGASASAP